ncbi:MAG TPA: hypothetical protein VEJ44_00575 [Acidimicrobiales bacterium]|nr:hypothetical protein [Acidimicrobiales bacterium]
MLVDDQSHAHGIASELAQKGYRITVSEHVEPIPEGLRVGSIRRREDLPEAG